MSVASETPPFMVCMPEDPSDPGNGGQRVLAARDPFAHLRERVMAVSANAPAAAAANGGCMRQTLLTLENPETPR